MNYTPKTPDHTVNSTKESSIKEFLLLALSLILIILAAFFAFDRLSAFWVDRMSEKTEAQIMKKFSRLDSMSLFGKTEKSEDLDQLVESLRSKVPQWRTSVAPGISCLDQVNAVALPNGQLVVLQGLLKQTKSEEELAFVIAHELGHFYHRHVLKALGRELLLSIFLSLMKSGDTHFSSPEQVASLMSLSFSRDAEKQADEFALALVYKKYGHIAGATDFFKKIKHEDNKLFEWSSTHPLSENRILDLEAMAKKNHWSIGKSSSIEFKNPCTTAATAKTEVTRDLR